MSRFSFWGEKTVISTRFRSVFAAAMFSMASAYVLILTDNVAAGQLVGENAVVSMTLVFPLITFIIFISYLIADGLAMMLSYAQGRGDREQVNQLFSMGVLLAVGVGLAFVAGMFFFRENLLAFWAISPQLMGYTRDYYNGLLFYAPLMFLNVFFYTVFVAEGQERVCVVGAVCTFVVNALLDIVLCLQIGVMGVGIATSCGLLAAVLVQLYFLGGGRSRLHFCWYWNTKDVLYGVVYSAYHSLDTLLLSLLPVALSSCVISHFGEEHMIVVTVAVNLLTLIIALYTGLVDCLQPMICQYHAEENLHSIQKTMDIGIRATVLISLLFTTLGMALAGFLPLLFGVQSEQMIAETEAAVRCFLLFIVFLGCTLMYSNYYIYIEKRNYGAVLKVLLLLGFPYVGMEMGARCSMNEMWLGTGAGFVLAYVFNLWWSGSKGKLFLDKEKLARQYSYDVDCTMEKVVALSRQVAEDMAVADITTQQRNLLTVLVEEIGTHASRRAKDKPFQMEFSILLGEKNASDLTLIVRDNGSPYDIIKTAQQGKFSYQDYFIESITVNCLRRAYLVSGDENRMILRIGA